MSEETKAIVPVEINLPMSKALPRGEEADTLFKWATVLSDTKYYQEMVASGGKNALAAILLAARDLDISASQAINSGMYIVQGKVSLSAQLMNTLVRRHGHSIVKMVSTDEICTWKGVRKDNGDTMTSTFSIKDAERAGLLKNPVWGKYPARMLSNRAFSALAKELFSDCIGNCYIEGEIETIDVTPEPEPMDKESILFINKFNLNDLDCPASKFIEGICANLKQERTKTIAQAAENPDKFEVGLQGFIKRKEAAKVAE